ncbi:alpha-ketoglutarate-dependent dioxygenase AlkB [Microlunatus panaciterrae]
MEALFRDQDAGSGRRLVAPGAVHLPGWLSLAQQQFLVRQFEDWSSGPVPIRAARLPGGRQMSVRMVCLGWHWQPYRYTREAADVNAARVLELPEWLGDLGRQALAKAYEDPGAAEAYRPDVALVNFYDDAATMGMHQDRDERSDAPVVSFSVGDTCRFRFGNTETRTGPYTDVELVSGDAFVFGGPSRFAYHGVPRIFPGSADPRCGLRSGRINLTLRVTGLPRSPS